MSPEELKVHYLEKLKTTELSDKGGAGLGMIDMARKSGNKLGYKDKFCTRKKKQAVLSWVQVALNLLRESAKYLNLLVESQGAGFYFRWA